MGIMKRKTQMRTDRRGKSQLLRFLAEWFPNGVNNTHGTSFPEMEGEEGSGGPIGEDPHSQGETG